MKITIVLGAFLPVPPIMGGAVEKVWFALGQEFARRGHEVTQISRALPQLPEKETIEGVRHLRIAGFDTPASLLWLKFFDLVYSVRTKRRLPRADIIVTNTFWLPLFLRNSRLGKLYVHIGRFPKRQMCLYKHAARLQTPSRAVANAVAKEVPELEAKIVAIPYPRLETNGSTGERATVEREKNILFVGRVHPEKGVHLLIDAFANAAAPLFSAWNLIIVGPTENRYGGGGKRYLDQLRRSATRAAGRVEFRGAIFDPVALSNEYRQAQIFAYPSLAEKGESFGLAPLEAMAHGCAVVVSDLACFKDFIRDGETGSVFNHRGSDPAAALRAKLAALVANETWRSQFAAAGGRKSAEYSLPQVADQFLADFELLIAHEHG